MGKFDASDGNVDNAVFSCALRAHASPVLASLKFCYVIVLSASVNGDRQTHFDATDQLNQTCAAPESCLPHAGRRPAPQRKQPSIHRLPQRTLTLRNRQKIHIRTCRLLCQTVVSLTTDD